ncbi:MAG: hypothetical protein P8Y36_10470, partial [Alphaproteobacteria bacterium]
RLLLTVALAELGARIDRRDATLREGGINPEHEDALEALFYEEEAMCYLDEVEMRSISCACYTMQSILTEDSGPAASAAGAVYNCIACFVDLRDDVDFNTPGAIDAMIGDPLVQMELARQKRDLKLLSAMEKDLEPVSLEKFRTLTKTETALPPSDELEQVT